MKDTTPEEFQNHLYGVVGYFHQMNEEHAAAEEFKYEELPREVPTNVAPVPTNPSGELTQNEMDEFLARSLMEEMANGLGGSAGQPQRPMNEAERAHRMLKEK